MRQSPRHLLRSLEGQSVNLALTDGSRIDDAVLVSGGSRTAWIYWNGADTFVPVDDVIEVWEAGAAA